jgi:2-amino-4-hydroxy-6-hydroxymethyldihydropteridine diphosphokinase
MEVAEDRYHHSAYIALGSNLGNRPAHIQGAVAALQQTCGIRLERVSRIIETKPVGGPRGQGDYLNAAARVRTSLGMGELLDALQDIERRFGRRRIEHWGPRTLDLDLLLYDDAVITTRRLTVPHPRMHERRFVLEPLCEIAPDVIHPVLRLTIRELLERLP